MEYYEPQMFEPLADSNFQTARQQLESQMLKYGIHTIYEGENHVKGQPTGEKALVCVVEKKGIKAQSELIPPYIVVNGQRIPTDIVAGPKPKDLRLYNTYKANWKSTQALSNHQFCHNCPIPGGVQIAPQGANWVGTLSCALIAAGKYAALTNAHVSGLDGLGKKCCQPSSRGDWIGTFTKVVGIRTDGQPNYIDAAIMDIERTDGLFAPSTHTVTPTQLDLGRIKPEPIKPQVGTLVCKSGRTTGVTRGRVVGVNATSYVGYDAGTAKFERQLVVEANSGSFSAGGDSGSLVLTNDMNPVGLLFAGGGGQTICNPIEFVLDWADAKFF